MKKNLAEGIFGLLGLYLIVAKTDFLGPVDDTVATFIISVISGIYISNFSLDNTIDNSAKNNSELSESDEKSVSDGLSSIIGAIIIAIIMGSAFASGFIEDNEKAKIFTAICGAIMGGTLGAGFPSLTTICRAGIISILLFEIFTK